MIPIGPEVAVIFLVLVLLFGADRIPKVAKSMGKSLGEFKKGRSEIEQEVQDNGDKV